MKKYVVISNTFSQGMILFESKTKKLYHFEFSKPNEMAMRPPFLYPIVFLSLITLLFDMILAQTNVMPRIIFPIIDIIWAAVLFTLFNVYNWRIDKKTGEANLVSMSRLDSESKERLLETIHISLPHVYSTINRYLSAFWFIIILSVAFPILSWLNNHGVLQISWFSMPPSESCSIFCSGIFLLEIAMYIFSFTSKKKRKKIYWILKTRINRDAPD